MSHGNTPSLNQKTWKHPDIYLLNFKLCLHVISFKSLRRHMHKFKSNVILLFIRLVLLQHMPHMITKPQTHSGQTFHSCHVTIMH